MQENKIPLDFISILEDFLDLALEELPRQLPPLQYIQHAIDLIPGLALPNHPAY